LITRESEKGAWLRLAVLAIRRESEGKERFIGAPKGETRIKPGDVVLCYSKEEVSRDLSQRLKGKSGDEGHHEKVDQETRRSQVREMTGDSTSRNQFS
jgi:uncharacterized protein with PhoU and TrkA domain